MPGLDFFGGNEHEKNNQNLTTSRRNDKNKVYHGEVIDIILNRFHPKYKVRMDIGKIYFRLFDSDDSGAVGVVYEAYPINSYSKKYPILHEIVEIIYGPDFYSGISAQRYTYYYRDIIGTRQTLNHNAMPYSTKDVTLQKTPKIQNYTKPVGAAPQTEPEINLGEYFSENIENQDIIPYEGDVIYQGRFGNSLRFSSTSTRARIKNFWSPGGDDGDPIVILRCSKYKPDSERFFVTEDINTDDNIIAICSNQKIPLTTGSTLHKTVGIGASSNEYRINTTPKTIREYKGPQTIVNSNRIVLNAKTDCVFVLAKNSINLSASDTVGIDSGKAIILNSEKKVYVGLRARQPALLGDDTINWIRDLCNALKVAIIDTPNGPGKINSIYWQTTIEPIIARLQQLKSTKLLLE